MVLDKDTYDKFFKQWQAWSKTGEKLPNRLLHPTKRKAFMAWNMLTWSGGHIYSEDEIVKTGNIVGPSRPLRVVQQSAGKLSNMRKFQPITITTSHITINRRELRDMVLYYRWLFQHPKILKSLAARHFYDQRTLRDSALFL